MEADIKALDDEAKVHNMMFYRSTCNKYAVGIGALRPDSEVKAVKVNTGKYKLMFMTVNCV